MPNNFSNLSCVIVKMSKGLQNALPCFLWKAFLWRVSDLCVLTCPKLCFTLNRQWKSCATVSVADACFSQCVRHIFIVSWPTLSTEDWKSQTLWFQTMKFVNISSVNKSSSHYNHCSFWTWDWESPGRRTLAIKYQHFRASFVLSNTCFENGLRKRENNKKGQTDPNFCVKLAFISFKNNSLQHSNQPTISSFVSHTRITGCEQKRNA